MADLREAALEVVDSAEFLGSMVAVSGWAARALASNATNTPAFIALETTLSKLDDVLESKRVDPAGNRLARAIIRADTLSVFAMLCARNLAPTRAAAPSRSAVSLAELKLMQVMYMVKHLHALVQHVDDSADAGLKQELVTALAHTQLLEHAARALLHAAHTRQSAPSAVAAAAAAAAPGTVLAARMKWETMSTMVSYFATTLRRLVADRSLGIIALSGRPRERDIMSEVKDPIKVQQLGLLEQLRPLLAGRCVQLFAAWAGLLAATTVQQQQPQAAAGGGSSVPQPLAPADAQLWHGLPLALMRLPPLGPSSDLEPVGLQSQTAEALAIVMQATVSGPCDLAIAQPSARYSHLPPQCPQHRQPRQPPQQAGPPPRPAATTTVAASAAAIAADAMQAAHADAALPFSALHAYRLLAKVWQGLACAGTGCLPGMYKIALVMARLLTELPPRRAAVLLPGWWRLVAQEPSVLVHDCRLAHDAGELLRLQLGAPPPASWAAEVADAASVAAASVDWPPNPAAMQPGGAGSAGETTPATVAAKAAASLARGRDPSYSLRCALDAGLLPALERCLRAPQSWRQADLELHSASTLITVVNCVLRYSGVWPAVLARGPVQQAASLIATLGAAARLLQEDDTGLGCWVPIASQPGAMVAAEGDACAYLCAYLAAMLEQVADVRALHECAQQQREKGQQQQQRQQQQQQPRQVAQPSSQQAATGAAAAAPTLLHLCTMLEPSVVVDCGAGSKAKPPTCSLAWMAAAGGLPAPGSAADRQQQLLTSFAVHHWLPVLAHATRAEFQDLDAMSGAGVERLLSQALLLGRLLLDVLWRDGGPWGEAGDGAGAGAGGAACSPRPAQGAWWEGAQLADELRASMQQIVYGLTVDAAVSLLERCQAWQQAAVLDLLQGYWARSPDCALTATEMWAMSTARHQQRSPGEQQKRQEQQKQQPHQQQGAVRQAGRSEGQADSAVGSSSSSSSSSSAGTPPELLLQCVRPLPVQRLAVAQGRLDLAEYLGAMAVLARERLARKQGGGADAAAASCTAAAQGSASSGSGSEGVYAARVIAGRWEQQWRAAAMRPRYPWLLSPGEVRAGLHDLMVAEAEAAAAAAVPVAGAVPAAVAAATPVGEPGAPCCHGGSSSSSGGGVGGGTGSSGSGAGQGSSSRASGGGPVFEHKLCGNPHCRSLDGPSAFIAPGSGKTCVRCRAMTYCCGACQLEDWRKRHSGTCSGAAAQAAGLGAARGVKAGLETA